MKCKDVRQELVSLLSGELSPEKTAVLQQHVQDCSHCSKEFVRLQMAEQRLRDGFNCTGDNGQAGELGQWVVEKARRLSGEEIASWQEWVRNLFREEDNVIKLESARPRKKALSTRGKIRVVVAVAFLAAVLFIFWPQVIRVSAQIPYLGDWIQELVFRDAGLNWAYQNGYINKDWIVVEQDGVKLTILGTVADPIQTAVIYMVEGLDVEVPRVSINRVEEGMSSWHGPPINTPLGQINMTQTFSLPQGEHELIFTLHSGGNLDSNLDIALTVNSEAISRISREYALDYQKTVEGVTVNAHRVVYTPTQIRVDYTINGGSGLAGPQPQDIQSVLLNGGGQHLSSGLCMGSQDSAEQWTCYEVFQRPHKLKDLRVLIPALGRSETIDLTFSQEDVGREFNVLDSKITLVSWSSSGSFWESEDILELELEFEGAVRDLTSWVITDASSLNHEVDWLSHIGSRQCGKFFRSVKGFPHIDDLTPQKITASQAQVIVWGEWEIPLPNED